MNSKSFSDRRIAIIADWLAITRKKMTSDARQVLRKV